VASSERVEALIAEAKDLIEKIAREGRAAVEEAERVAGENVERHRSLIEERRSLQHEAERLQAERERLPVEHSRAMLEDDVDRELRIKDRYGEIAERLEEISARLPEVERELSELCPRECVEGGHENDVLLQQYRPVNRAAATSLSTLRSIAKEIHDAAERHAGYFEQVIEDRKSESYGWREAINWDPRARAKLQGPNTNLPGPGRGKVIAADPESLRQHGGEPRRLSR
jgi:DNA repair exonuclease SbcCD ATPase subunit